MIAFCKDKQRRNLVLQTNGVNGLDYLEVLGTPGCGNQLALTFLRDARGLALTPSNISLTGDTLLQATNILPATSDDPLTITVQLSGTGDFSPYTLALVTSQTNPDPAPGIDPQLNSATFSFKAGCPTPLDCLTSQCCPSTLATPPDIHYLARDYDKFRQAMLDRIAVLVPGWTETHEADPGIALVEALAYAADRVSYLQDAVNTEAYIGTARSRISLRRHARLVDYQISEGANARAWVCLSLNPNFTSLTVPAGTPIYPLIPGLAASIDPNEQVYAASQLQSGPGPVFETMESITLYPEQNQMDFYAWGDSGCCLPAGATEATLTGTPPNGAYQTLQAGQVLIFEEVKGPLTGDAADADPTHRCAVRLTYASTTDYSGNPLVDPVNPSALLTAIAWNSDDALPFPLCISSISAAGIPVSGVSVARGNVVATDQGVWTNNESLGVVPLAPAAPVSGVGCNCTADAGALVPRPRFEPVLADQPLTFAASYNTSVPAAQMPSATSFLAPDISTATPQISVASDDGQSWSPVEDLLSKDGEYPGFIPEIEWDGTAHLRFGDGTYGAAPETGVKFTATYRTGNGAAGNVGREALAHVVTAGGAGITGVRNPLAAAGGVDPESTQHIVQFAPFAFQSQMRCVTAADYGTMAATLNGVAQAQGTLRWTGSWYSAFVSIDPIGVWTSSLATQVKTSLNMLRMMGVDLVVEQAIFIGIRIGLEICVAPGFFRGDVYAAVWKALVTGDSCSGTLGFLNAANFQFGQTVYASPIVSAAQSVTGVAAVTLQTFERMNSPTAPGVAPPTQLLMGSIELPRCDNDPNHADRGMLTLIMDGGK
ncbi:MAG TPA: hypothetical protein VG225_03415 [Terracidiphilus sp.]|jgi:hypothetical protein|nr:hypothetical protein [Terracidiphilus sp.]